VLLLGLVCTNVASLLVARAIARQREIAVRLALGASRARLMLQLFTESVLLALIGGGLGVAGVYWALGFVRRFPVSDIVDLAPDWRVLLVALLVSLVSAVLFGAAPVLQSLRTDVRSALGSGTVTGDRSRLRGVLITAQVAMSCVLILLAVTSTRGVRTQVHANPGVPLAGLISGRLNLRALEYDTVRRRLYATQVPEIIASTPGVNAVATTTLIPFGAVYTRMTLRLPDGVEPIVERNTVSVDYFRVLRVRVLEGRVFDERDRAGATPVGVVNRTLRRTHPQAGPGTIVDVGRDQYVQIVGVVDDIQYHDMAERPRPLLYLAAEQANAEDLFASLVIAVTPGAEEAMAGELRRRIGDRFPDLVPPRLLSLHDRLELETLAQRIAARVALGIGAVELVLAGVGLYGLLLFALLTRMREVGVRLALGAAPRVASWTVLKGGLRHAALGTVIGLALGVPASMAAKSAIPGVRETDLLPYVIAAATVACAAVLAALVPALRAARVQPAAALRVD
jgi:putative ABC transport system permease protein